MLSDEHEEATNTAILFIQALYTPRVCNARSKLLTHTTCATNIGAGAISACHEPLREHVLLVRTNCTADDAAGAILACLEPLLDP